MDTEPITEDWLRSVGFKWHQFDRQPGKHWLLWLGNAVRDGHSLTSFEDIGIEVAPCAYRNRNGDLINEKAGWFCWLRSDAAGRYHRFLHIRHLHTVADLIRLVEGLTGQDWDPANNLYGSMYRPEDAARLRIDDERIDRRLSTGAADYLKWSEVEKDDTRGRALPEHLEAHAKTRGNHDRP